MKTAQIVHIVDDGPAIRDSLGLLLEPSGFDARTYDSAKAFLAASRGPGGCVLMDVRMPEIDGLELQQRLDERGIHLPVIVMIGQGDVPLAVRAVKAGAVDFLEKPFDDAALLDAVRRALKASQRLQLLDAVVADAAQRLATPTPRAHEVLDRLVSGLVNKAVANKLGASLRTIEVHRARVFEKLQVHSLPEPGRLVTAAGPRNGS